MMLPQLVLFPFIDGKLIVGYIGIKGFQQWIYSNTVLLPLIPAIIIVGGFIIFTLSYVSWRKYKAERQKTRETKEKKDKIVD